MNKHIYQSVKIMMTGGHITPAIATIEELDKQHPDWEIVFIGRKTALEGYVTHSEEYRLIRGLGLKFFPISAGRLKREGGVSVIMALMKFPVGIVQAAWHIARQRPDIIVSFGGYIALPVVLVAWMWQIPIVTHEQTTRLGLANRVIARMATRICVSFPDTVTQFPGNTNLVVTGLPVRQSVFSVPKSGPFTWDPKFPLLFIVGGSTGSTSINDLVFRALPALLSRYTVIHQVGRISESRARDVKGQLHASVRNRYQPLPYITAEAYSFLLHKAALIIGRSGANTVMEIAISAKIAIFIPLPWSGDNEQYYNAKILQDAGSALVLEQKHVSADSLVMHVHAMMEALPERSRKAKAFAARIPHDGAKRFVTVIADVLSV